MKVTVNVTESEVGEADFAHRSFPCISCHLFPLRDKGVSKSARFGKSLAEQASLVADDSVRWVAGLPSSLSSVV